MVGALTRKESHEAPGDTRHRCRLRELRRKPSSAHDVRVDVSGHLLKLPPRLHRGRDNHGWRRSSGALQPPTRARRTLLEPHPAPIVKRTGVLASEMQQADSAVPQIVRAERRNASPDTSPRQCRPEAVSAEALEHPPLRRPIVARAESEHRFEESTSGPRRARSLGSGDRVSGDFEFARPMAHRDCAQAQSGQEHQADTDRPALGALGNRATCRRCHTCRSRATPVLPGY